MFFFLIGGVDQKVAKVVKEGVSRCINCGSKADLVNYDYVLKLFFVPVWHHPAKHPILHCPTCNLFYPPPPPPQFSSPPSQEPDLLECSSCARFVRPDYRFCPFCGVSL